MQNKVLFPISNAQLAQFKRHAVMLADMIVSLDSKLLIKGRKRVDILAQACGYNSHSQLVRLSDGYDQDKPLELFSPENADVLAGHISENHELKFDIVIASIIKSSMQLYDAGQCRWRVKDVDKYDRKVWYLVNPESKEIDKMLSRFAIPTVKIPKLPDTFKAFESVRKLGLVSHLHKSTFNPSKVYSFAQAVETMKQQTSAMNAIAKFATLPKHPTIEALEKMRPQINQMTEVAKVMQSQTSSIFKMLEASKHLDGYGAKSE